MMFFKSGLAKLEQAYQFADIALSAELAQQQKSLNDALAVQEPAEKLAALAAVKESLTYKYAGATGTMHAKMARVESELKGKESRINGPAIALGFFTLLAGLSTGFVPFLVTGVVLGLGGLVNQTNSNRKIETASPRNQKNILDKSAFATAYDGLAQKIAVVVDETLKSDFSQFRASSADTLKRALKSFPALKQKFAQATENAFFAPPKKTQKQNPTVQPNT